MIPILVFHCLYFPSPAPPSLSSPPPQHVLTFWQPLLSSILPSGRSCLRSGSNDYITQQPESANCNIVNFQEFSVISRVDSHRRQGLQILVIMLHHNITFRFLSGRDVKASHGTLGICQIFMVFTIENWGIFNTACNTGFSPPILFPLVYRSNSRSPLIIGCQPIQPASSPVYFGGNFNTLIFVCMSVFPCKLGVFFYIHRKIPLYLYMALFSRCLDPPFGAMLKIRYNDPG